MIQQSFCTARDLEELGLARDRLQAIALPQRLRAIRAASGVLAPYLRKRQGLPLIPRIDDEELDVSGMTAGAVVTHDDGPARHARDIVVAFPAGGTVGAPGITYTLDLAAGAYGSTPSAPLPLPLSGQLAIDGYTWTIAGAVAAGDAFAYSARVDSGVATASAWVAAALLLGADGIDPTTLETLQKRHDAAVAWSKDVGKGDGDLDPDADATPQRAEAGPLFTGQHRPWDFIKFRRTCG